MTDTTDDTETRMTRRDALKGGSAAAVAAGSLLLQKQLVSVATAQTTEPRINLGDNYAIDDNPDGNGDLVITDLSNDTEVLRYDLSESQWTLSDVTTETLSITNETYFRVSKTGSNESVSSNTWANPFDGQSAGKDVRGEWDQANGQLTPDNTADYHITATVVMNGNSDGDRYQIRFQGDDGTTIAFYEVPSTGTTPFPLFLTSKDELTSGVAYMCEVKNVSNTDEIQAVASSTHMEVEKISRG